jgi:hypothetical protein
MRALQGILSNRLRGSPLAKLLALTLTLVGAYEAADFIIAGVEYAMARQQPRWVT